MLESKVSYRTISQVVKSNPREKGFGKTSVFFDDISTSGDLLGCVNCVLKKSE